MRWLLIGFTLLVAGTGGAQTTATGGAPCSLDALVAAYDASPQPERLYDLAQCHRQLGHHEEAIFFFDGYLERGHDVDRAAVDALIRGERAELVREAKLTAPTLSAAPAPRRPIYKRWWLWTGVGVVALGGAAAAIALGVKAAPRLPSGALGTIDAR